MSENIKELARQLRLAREPIRHTAADALEAAAREVASLQNTFDLMWKADMRAIKLWQAATGRDHVWPDRAKTTLWLLERLDAAEAERDRLKEALEDIGRQKTSEEMEGYEAFDADFEGGWDTVVTNARKALGDAS